MVLWNTSAQDDGSRFRRLDGYFGQFLDVFDDVDHKIILVRVGKEHVPDASISDRRAEDRDVVLICPVVNALFVVYLLPESLDHLPGRPLYPLFLLLLGHLGEERQQEVFQLDVVVIRQEDVTNPAVAVEPIFDIIHVELCQVESAHTLHEVLLYSSGSGDDTVDHLVLSQVSNDLPHATGDHIGSIAQVDGAPLIGPIDGVLGFLVISLVDWLIGKPPADHAVDDLDGLLQMTSLKPCGPIALKNLLIVDSLIKIIALYSAALKLLDLAEESLHLLLQILLGKDLRLFTHVQQSNNMVIRINYLNHN